MIRALTARQDTGLLDSMARVSEMSEIPFEKELELGVKTGVQTILQFWRDKYYIMSQ